MNWYKKAQLDITDQRGTREDDTPENRFYTQIGHGIYNRERPSEKANIMWVLVNGSIDTEIEDFGRTVHGLVSRWEGLDFNSIYTGRYSLIKKIITVLPPSEGMRKYRAVPTGVSSLLKMKFPDARQLYVF